MGMETPICDFAKRYAAEQNLRLHMPGHKGSSFLGMEEMDLTEIDGADSLYEANGIIRQSEENAGRLFGCETLYSTEGSSLCIRAMLYLTVLYSRERGKRPLVAAGRNAHKTFLSAAALLDLDIDWLYPAKGDSYLSCSIDPTELEDHLLAARERLPVAVYLTSPDYLGNTVDLAAIAAVCHRYGVLLLVDNAHGAYMRFLPVSAHPIDLGADLCCDSAHKTLPVLTGGAYLHLASGLPDMFRSQAKNAMAMFGSTSPSYLILQSLDRANRYLAEGYPVRLANCVQKVEQCRKALADRGYVFRGSEALKLTVCTKQRGYTGTDFAAKLAEQGIVCEFADPDFTVLMVTPETGEIGLQRLFTAMDSIPQREPILAGPPVFHTLRTVLPVRDAMFAARETVPAAECAGRILAHASVGCPPAVPIAVSGERMDAQTAAVFAYYGITACTVVREVPTVREDKKI